MLNPVLAQLGDAVLIAVLRSRSAADALEVARTLVEAGVTALEITFTTPAADTVISTLTRELDRQVLIGAGTVLTASQADAALAAGAHFLVSPGLPPNPQRLFAACGQVPLIPGVLTPTELMAALEHGAEAVKIFPASTAGLDHLAALRGPFPDVPMIPTGGINADNIAFWVAAGALAVGVGGNLCPPRLASDADRAALLDTASALLTTASAVKAALTQAATRGETR